MQTVIDYKYLNLINLTNFDLWDTKRYTSKSIVSSFPMVDLGSCIKEENKKYKLFENEDKEFGILGVNNKEGIFDAHTQKGKDINQAYKKMEIGWIAYNPYRINVGSIGVRLKEHKNEYISPAYVVFSCLDNLLPEYLFLLFKTERFNKVINESTTGSVRQNLTIDTLKNLQIPLPSLSVQEDIVKVYQSKIQEAQNLELQTKELEKEIEKYFLDRLGLEKNEGDILNSKGLSIIEYSKLEKWSIDHMNKRTKGIDISKSHFTKEQIKNLLLFFEGGKTPSKSRKDFWNGDVFWTSPKDFTNKTILDTAIDTITQTALNDAGVKLFPKGTLLSVFRSGILRHSFPTVITEIETTINQDLKAYALKEDLINKYYYLYFVNIFKDYILLNTSKKSVTVESINTEDFLELPIVLPPLAIQREITATIGALKSKIKTIKNQYENLIVRAKQKFEQALFN